MLAIKPRTIIARVNWKRAPFVTLSVLWATITVTIGVEMLVNWVLGSNIKPIELFPISAGLLLGSVFLTWFGTGRFKRLGGWSMVLLHWTGGACFWIFIIGFAMAVRITESRQFWSMILLVVIAGMVSEAILARGKRWGRRVGGRADEVDEAYARGYADALK